MNLNHEWQKALIEEAEEYCIWCNETKHWAQVARCPEKFRLWVAKKIKDHEPTWRELAKR